MGLPSPLYQSNITAAGADGTSPDWVVCEAEACRRTAISLVERSPLAQTCFQDIEQFDLHGQVSPRVSSQKIPGVGCRLLFVDELPHLYK